MRDFYSVAIVLAIASYICFADKPSRYSLHDGFNTWDVGLGSVNGHVAALGDFDGDKKTDIIVVESSGVVSVHIWNSGAYKFQRMTDSSITVPSGEYVANVVASDFNFDGNLDILVVTLSSTSTGYTSRLYLGDRISISTSAEWQGTMLSHPLLLDMDMNQRVDLLGSTSSGTVQWINTPQGEHGVLLSPKVIDRFPQLAETPSNAFVDLDGDCFPEIFVAGDDKFHIFHYADEAWDENTGVSFTDTIGAQQVSFVDVDGDGNIDMVIPFCDPLPSCSRRNTIRIVFNVQMGMCGHETSTLKRCRKSDNLCVGDTEYAFTTSIGDIVDIPLPQEHILASASELSVSSVGIEAPISVQSGDLDLDGYADLVVILKNVKSGIHFASVFLNVECTTAICTPEAISNKRRTFKRHVYTGIEEIPNVFSASIFDLNEDGSNDFLIQVINPVSLQQEILLVLNNLNADAYFFKTIGLNGVCPAWCGDSGTTFPSHKPYGVNHPGVTSKFAVTAVDGSKNPKTGSQLWRSAYLSLGTPYSMFGIGRTNNYIEHCFVGFPLSEGNADNFQTYVSMIPNSQVYVFPYPPGSPSSWLIELLISPSESIVYVVGSLVCTFIVTSVAILIFHNREQKKNRPDPFVPNHFITF